ncbi:MULTISPECIES: AAA family ATPase [Coprococcus]|jgi:AAA15 family ATPase/GTPase|uniref:AAA family ATPase n=1 Tax=Coprococcus TaxID=33042 RepID=UPI000E73203E|nr:MULTISPECIES: ATP-binding protein [Coprococcus]RJW77398.1 ATP-binding protein [Coprococcus sp. AF38-1]
MIIRYMFDNFCSFNAESEFSMEAPGGKVKKRFPDNYTTTLIGYDLLKTAVIVGENAGGKSNFINSLKYLKSLFDTNLKVQSVNAYINTDTLVNEKIPKQRFNIVFVARNHFVYEYEVVVDSLGIYSEKLIRSQLRKRAASEVFEIKRDSDSKYIQKRGKAKEIATVLENSNNSYGLFVSKLALLGNADAAETVDWMADVLYPGTLPSEQVENIIRQESDIEILKDPRYVEIFRMVDYSICGIEVDEEKPYSKTMIIRSNANGQTFKRELSQDSTGVREFFAWAVQIFRVVYADKVVFADEMDRVLNPILSERVIAYINGMEHKGQFIFSTHNVLHLNLKTYMKEQIYFITKNRENLVSELYSLADFPEVRYENTKIYEFYMKGILGGTAFE